MPSLEGIRIKDVDQDLYRNIVSLRESRDLFGDLSDDPAHWAAAQHLEMTTKPMQYDSGNPIISRPFEEADYREAVQFPFDHWAVSRFSDGSFGVWYGAEDLETTIAETVHHWRTGLLADAGWQGVQGVSIERRVHLVRCTAGLLDLTAQHGRWPWLTADSYPQCQELGARVHRDGYPGLWTPSARCEGVCTPIFRPGVLSSPRVQCYLTYRVEEDGVCVERQPGVTLMRL